MFMLLSVIANPLHIVIEQPGETFWGILLKAVPSLLGVAAGSFLTWLFTSHADNKKNLKLFILSKQNDTFIPLLRCIEKMIKRYIGTDYIQEHYELSKRFDAKVVKNEEWFDFFIHIKSEATLEHQGNYTKAIWKELNNINSANTNFQALYGKSGLQLYELFQLFVNMKCENYCNGLGDLLNSKQVKVVYDILKFEDMVLGIKIDSYIDCIESIEYHENDIITVSRGDVVFKPTTSSNAAPVNTRQAIIGLFQSINKGLREDIPHSEIGMNPNRYPKEGVSFYLSKQMMVKKARKEFEQLIGKLSKCAEIIRKKAIVF